MYDKKRFIIYLLLSALLVLLSCGNQQNDSFNFTGEWTIEAYQLYSEVEGEVLNDQTYKDAGFFRFMNNGSGTATIQIPGISLPQNNPISWSYHQESDQFTIDYNTGQDPFIYHVSLQSKDCVQLLNDRATQSDDSTSLLRTIIEISKKS